MKRGYFRRRRRIMTRARGKKMAVEVSKERVAILNPQATGRGPLVQLH
jgi:hypothetical protein